MKHHVMILVLLLATAVCDQSIHKAQRQGASAIPSDVVLDVPETIGMFKAVGSDIDVGEHVRSVLETSSILMRDYVSSRGWPVQLTIVHAGTTRRSLHFPEVCLVGQGWEVREQYAAPVGFLFTAKRLVLVKGEHKEAVLYWFKTGDRFTGSYFLNSWYWTLGQARFKAPTSTMVKLSAPIGEQGEANAFQMLEEFAVQLAPILMERIT